MSRERGNANVNRGIWTVTGHVMALTARWEDRELYMYTLPCIYVHTCVWRGARTYSFLTMSPEKA